MKQWKGFGKRSISDSIALHTPPECEKFANLLLDDDYMLVRATRRENPDNSAFVKTVLEKRYSSAVPFTWKDLIDCMKNAGLDELMIKTIEDNL